MDGEGGRDLYRCPNEGDHAVGNLIQTFFPCAEEPIGVPCCSII